MIKKIELVFQEIMKECEKYDPRQLQEQEAFEAKESYKSEFDQ